MPREPWTPEEVNALIEDYPSKSKETLLKMFPNRTWIALKDKAIELKIRRSHPFINDAYSYLPPYRRFYWRHREKRLAQRKEYYNKNKGRIRQECKDKWQIAKNTLKKMLGGKCCLCAITGREPIGRLEVHEINGRPHRTNTPFLYLKNPANYALLCTRHHLNVHFCLDLGISWNEVKERLERSQRVEVTYH